MILASQLDIMEYEYGFVVTMLFFHIYVVKKSFIYQKMRF